ncbi:MAG: helix-turn-helix domain-containing protein [Clostridia bacterium]|nr:helix-turn-helix domain-containing protein [Clostridia bacterium]
MKLQEKIYTCRKKKGLSQEALAEMIGVSRQAVSKWETGEAVPDITNFAALAAALGVSADWLLSDKEDADDAGADETSRSGGEDFLAAIPGFIGRMLRRYGWLSGVYLAVSGVLFTAIGALARFLSSLIFGGVTTVTESQTVVIDGIVFENPVQMSDPLIELPANLAKNNPVALLGGAIMIFGIILIVGGTALAVWLKKRSM